METESLMDAATLSGRQQAFAYVASHAAAARAECLRKIHQTRAYESLGLTWEEFCIQRAGISRFYADILIHRLAEFGESYFKLSEFARLSPETYRQIAPYVHDDVLEIDGQTLPLTSENAPRIRTVIRHLQHRLRQAEARSDSSITELKIRVDALFQEISRRTTQRTLPIDELIALRAMSEVAARKWRAIFKALKSANPPLS
jgi:hypothetical protein